MLCLYVCPLLNLSAGGDAEFCMRYVALALMYVAIKCIFNSLLWSFYFKTSQLETLKKLARDNAFNQLKLTGINVSLIN